MRIIFCGFYSFDFTTLTSVADIATLEKVYKITFISNVFPVAFSRRHNMVLIHAVSIVRYSLVIQSSCMSVSITKE